MKLVWRPVYIWCHGYISCGIEIEIIGMEYYVRTLIRLYSIWWTDYTIFFWARLYWFYYVMCLILLLFVLWPWRIFYYKSYFNQTTTTRELNWSILDYVNVLRKSFFWTFYNSLNNEKKRKNGVLLFSCYGFFNFISVINNHRYLNLSQKTYINLF